MAVQGKSWIRGRKRSRWGAATFCLLGGAGCGGHLGGPAGAAVPAAGIPTVQQPRRGTAEAAERAAPSGEAEDNPSRRPLLVRTATLTVQSFPVQESLDRITAIAEELGGYLARRTDDQVEVRVPEEHFDVAIDAVMAAVDEVVLWDAQAEDVYEDRRNLAMRLDNLRALESRLLRTREMARTAYGALLVERDLLEVTQAIEQAQGRLQDLDERIAFATLVVTHSPVSRADP